MILGNKCDMTDKRVVSKERGEQIAREHDIRFMETSAKANINIEKAFCELAEAILDKTTGKDDPNLDRVRVGEFGFIFYFLLILTLIFLNFVRLPLAICSKSLVLFFKFR
jgi:hypothetical protein